jgi:hypothetical protein
LVIAVAAALLLTACGVMRGEQESGLHRLRVMVPNSPGGGYDLTASSAGRAPALGSRATVELNDQYFHCELIRDLGHPAGPLLLSITAQ